MVDPNKHGVYNKNKIVKPNWGMIGVLSLGIGFWTSVWFNGFFITTTWLIVISAIFGMWFRLTGRG